MFYTISKDFKKIVIRKTHGKKKNFPNSTSCNLLSNIVLPKANVRLKTLDRKKTGYKRHSLSETMCKIYRF